MVLLRPRNAIPTFATEGRRHETGVASVGQIARAPRHSARLLISHHRLLWRVTWTEVRARYAGSLFGLAWFVLSPLLILGIYGTVYLFIFRVSVPGLTPVRYMLYIFAGLVPFLATSEALSLGVGSVISNRSVLNNTVFPIDLAPAKAVLSSQGVMTVGMAIVVLGTAATGTLAWTCLLLPVLWILHGLAALGFLWMLSLLNVVFRDTQNIVNILLMVTLIASPIAYSPEMVPPVLRPLVILNPLAYFLVSYQRILVLGKPPSMGDTVVVVLLSLGLFGLGGWLFARSKRVIVDYV